MAQTPKVYEDIFGQVNIAVGTITFVGSVVNVNYRWAGQRLVAHAFVQTLALGATTAITLDLVITDEQATTFTSVATSPLLPISTTDDDAKEWWATYEPPDAAGLILGLAVTANSADGVTILGSELDVWAYS